MLATSEDQFDADAGPSVGLLDVEEVDEQGDNESEQQQEQPARPPQIKLGTLEYIKQLWDSLRMTLFVVGTALTVFVAARNTITWYLIYYTMSILIFHSVQTLLNAAILLYFNTLKATLCATCEVKTSTF